MRSGISHRLSMLALACVVRCSACTTTKELVVLLTGEDGTIGSVAVTAPAGALVLTTPLAAAAISSAGEVTPSTTTPEAAQQLAYTAGAEAMPRPARSFRLYFREKSADIVATSLPELETLLAEVAKRDAAEVEITGHTDRVGTVADNDQLSIERAEVVRDMLRKPGLATQFIRAVGRGEREPLIPTPDEQPEPRNRRVEILVR